MKTLDLDWNSLESLTYPIEKQFLQENLVVKMRLDGRDIAGNTFEKNANSFSYPAGVWKLEHHTTEFSLEQSGIELSKSNLEVDENTIVQIHVRNDGMLGGDAEVLVEIVDLLGQRSQLAKPQYMLKLNQSIPYLSIGSQTLQGSKESKSH